MIQSDRKIILEAKIAYGEDDFRFPPDARVDREREGAWVYCKAWVPYVNGGKPNKTP